jgi:transcriptional regulator with XRE-family HTH domain
MSAVSDPDDLRRQIQLAPLAFIGGRVRRARRLLGLSHDALGARMGMTRQQLIKIEQAKHRPQLETLLRISKATGKPLEWFVDPEVDPSPFSDEDEAAA